MRVPDFCPTLLRHGAAHQRQSDQWSPATLLQRRRQHCLFVGSHLRAQGVGSSSCHLNKVMCKPGDFSLSPQGKGGDNICHLQRWRLNTSGATHLERQKYADRTAARRRWQQTFATTRWRSSAALWPGSAPAVSKAAQASSEAR